MNKQRVFSFNAFLILAMCLYACPQSPGKLKIRVRSEKFQTETHLIIKGENFTPGKRVAISIANVPKSEVSIPKIATADAKGSFTISEAFTFRRVPRDAEFINILVTARDETTGQLAIEHTSPEPYLIRF